MTARCVVGVVLVGALASACTGVPSSSTSLPPAGTASSNSSARASSELAAGSEVTLAPNRTRLPDYLEPKEIAACQDGDSAACWHIGKTMWETAPYVDDAAAASLVKRACELSFHTLYCWVAADLMRTRILEPHDKPDLPGSAALLARVCDAAVERSTSHTLLQGFVEGACFDAALALKTVGSSKWTIYAERACALGEAGCILGAEALGVEARYEWLGNRCEKSIPASRGGSAPDASTDGKLFRFDDCYAASLLQQSSAGKLAPRTLTTLHGLANAMAKTLDDGVGQNAQLGRIPGPIWPELPASYSDPETAKIIPREAYLGLVKLRYCLRGGEKAVCDEAWDWDGGDLLLDPLSEAERGCRGLTQGGYSTLSGISCGVFAQSIVAPPPSIRGRLPLSGRTRATDQADAVAFARRACWLDDWTCGVYAKALALTGGPSNEITFEYRRACDAGNKRACKDVGQ